MIMDSPDNGSLLHMQDERQEVSPLHRPLTSTSPGGQSLGPKSAAAETWNLPDLFSKLKKNWS